MKNYIYADFTRSCGNFGNEIIEFATQRMIGGKANEIARFDSFDVNGFNTLGSVSHDFVLIPGCTMLTFGQNKGLNGINESAHTIVCLAGSIWTNDYLHRSFYLGKRRLLHREPRPVSLDIVRKLSGPIGCRDRFTFETLRAEKFDVRYVGCPTLFLDATDVTDSVVDHDYILFSFGRENLRAQVRKARELARKIPVIAVSHEKNDNARIRSAGWQGPLVTSADDIRQYLSYFAHASCVITGRLHGLLPSIAFNKKVVYFGSNDSRTTIFDDLAVPTWRLSDVGPQIASRSWNPYVIGSFREKMTRLVDDLLC